MSEQKPFREMIAPLAAAGAILIFSGCARHESPPNETPVATDHTAHESRNYGFWPGLVHGVIAPISVIGEVAFNDGKGDDIVMYSPDNNGKPYTIGFTLGAGILLRGSKASNSRRRKN